MTERYVRDHGVYTNWAEVPPETLRLDEAEVEAQKQRVRAFRAGRDQPAVDAALRAVGETARGTGNLLQPMKGALLAGATLGEVSDALREVFGEYRPTH